MTEAQESINRFAKALTRIEGQLKDIETKDKYRADKIFAILDETTANLAEASLVRDDASGLRRQMDESLKALRESVGSCKKALEEKSRVRQALKKADENARAIVIVFGRTNAGKSTLGNFFRGKTLRDAPFDNGWKNGAINPGPIKVIETAADGKDVESGEREWFKEGATETTRECQYFTLPGLLWVDTPGVASNKDEIYGEMARKYAKNADLVIYLDHSDNPGLTGVSANLLELLANGQETLVAINHSDKTGFLRKGPDGMTLFGDDGKPLRERIAKPAEDRRAQEEQVIRGLLERGFNPDNNLKAISVSMLLANEAITKNDDSLYAGSNLALLLDQIQSVFATPEKIKKVCERPLLSARLDLCALALGERADNRDEMPGLIQQIEAQEALLNDLRRMNNEFVLEDEIQSAARKLSLHASDGVRKILDAAKNAPAKKNRDDDALLIDFSALENDLMARMATLVNEKIYAITKKLFANASFAKVINASGKLSRLKLERQYETQEYEVPKPVIYERDPDGFWEHVGSFFGKKYYGVSQKMIKRKNRIDLGYDLEGAYAKACATFKELINENVGNLMAAAKRDTLGYAIQKVEITLAILKKAAASLADIKTQIETEMSDGH